jgi:DNA mismatch endonuclease, patch repair protein
VDNVPPRTRSRMMAGVRQRHTAPELLVRKVLHSLGLRFRLHKRDLPGSPDIVLQRWKTVILVHGCFWHRHGCNRTTTPSTRSDFWLRKFERNVQRDRECVGKLRRLGWRVVVVWECETRQPIILHRRLRRLFRTPVRTGL